MDSQTFGKQQTFNGKGDCDKSRFVYVPVVFTSPAAAAGEKVFSDLIDLSSFIQGAPSPFVNGFQSLIVYQRNSDSDVINNDGFISEFVFDNQFKCFSPGRSFSALTILCSDYPKVTINVFAQQAVAAPMDARVDLYFCNFPIDEVTLNFPVI